MLPTPDPTTRTTSPDSPPRHRVGRRRLLALAAGAALATGGLVVANAGPATAIVAGEDTTAGENPWQVALTADGEQFCGGSLVSDRVVVTAAHCVVGTDAADIQIRAGVSDLSSDEGQTVRVAGVVEHPTYSGGSADIAMLVLDQPVTLNDRVAAIPIATADEAAAATEARVTGWGALSEADERVPDVLQTADVPTVGDDVCESALDGVDGANELCAGGTGTDSCYGDSGGPLTILTDRGRVLAGVTSWGEECGGETPGVYAEVPAFADWIDERVVDPDAPLPERLDIDLMDDEFFEDDWPEDLDDGWFDDEPTDEVPADEVPAGDLEFDHDAIDQLDDDAWEEWLDGLSDDEFERYLDELDTLWGDVDESWDGEADDGSSDDLGAEFDEIPLGDEWLDDI